MIAEPVDLAAILAEIARPSHGAQLLFTGTIRDDDHGRRVVAVSYDVLSPLCEKVIGEICAEAQARCAASLSLAVVQRRGRIEAGQVGIAIAVGAPHRAEAYAASRHLIEQVKARAPIWKREHYADGESAWLKGHALCAAPKAP